MKENLYQLALRCKTISDERMGTDKTLIPYRNLIFTDYTVKGPADEYLKAIVDCVLALEKENHAKRIFISHSSKDKYIMEKFTDHILQLGIGLSHEDIFCTSIEEMGIKNGEDIRRHIRENVCSTRWSAN